MSSDMAKCVNFSVFLDIAEVSRDVPTQIYHNCVYHVVFDWTMVLVLMGGVQMSSDMTKCSFFTGTDIMCSMCELCVPAIHICMPNICTYYILYRNDLLNPD